MLQLVRERLCERLDEEEIDTLWQSVCLAGRSPIAGLSRSQQSCYTIEPCLRYGMPDRSYAVRSVLAFVLDPAGEGTVGAHPRIANQLLRTARRPL
jgi:hypothetical protein